MITRGDIGFDWCVLMRLGTRLGFVPYIQFTEIVIFYLKYTLSILGFREKSHANRLAFRVLRNNL